MSPYTGDRVMLIRYVDDTPTSEVPPITIPYIHPPCHDSPKVMVMKDPFTSKNRYKVTEKVKLEVT